MKTFVFKSSLVITSILLLMSYVGGAPMSVAAAAVTLAWSPTTSPGSFDYGTLNAGQTQSQQFTLTDGRNSGVLSASLSGSPAFSITSDGCTGVKLHSNESCLVTVQYAPTGFGQSDTATLSASSKKADSVGITLTGASATPCSPLSVTLDPPSGYVAPGLDLLLDANEHSGCTETLEYIWDCFPPDSTECPAFLAAANGTSYENSEVILAIGADERFEIGLTVCVAGTTNCTLRIYRLYASPGF